MSKNLTFRNNLIASQAKQVVFSHGLNAIKSQFLNFDTPKEQDRPDKYSALGTPIFDALTIYGNGTDGAISYFDPSLQKTVTVQKLVIDIALIEVSKNVKVVRTSVAGANGDVKQYINLGDYNITIKGVFTSENADTRPEDFIRQLNTITSATCEVNVASNFLLMFGITSIVFADEQNFAMDESSRDVQKFTLNCISETPFAIKVTQQGTTTSNPAI